MPRVARAEPAELSAAVSGRSCSETSLARLRARIQHAACVGVEAALASRAQGSPHSQQRADEHVKDSSSSSTAERRVAARDAAESRAAERERAARRRSRAAALRRAVGVRRGGAAAPRSFGAYGQAATGSQRCRCSPCHCGSAPISTRCGLTAGGSSSGDDTERRGCGAAGRMSSARQRRRQHVRRARQPWSGGGGELSG